MHYIRTELPAHPPYQNTHTHTHKRTCVHTLRFSGTWICSQPAEDLLEDQVDSSAPGSHSVLMGDGKFISDLIRPVGTAAWLSSWLRGPRWPDGILYTGLRMEKKH